MTLQKKITELKGSIYVNKTDVLKELGVVADKIPSKIEQICKSWFWAKKPSALKLQVLVDMLTVAMKGLFVENSKENQTK